MEEVFSLLWTGGITIAPFVLLYQYFRIKKRYGAQSKAQKRTVLGYFAGIVSIAYAIGIAVLWIYMWFIYVPNTSPGTSFTPESQRLLGIVSFGSLAFLFAAPVVAASLLTLNSAYKQQK